MNDTRKQLEGFPKYVRLLQSHEIRTVFDHNQSVADDTLIVYGRRQELHHTRLGLVVSRKIGNAVVRNRWKRNIRDVFRKHLSSLPTGVDILVLPRPGATPKSVSIGRSLPNLVRRLLNRLNKDKLA